MLSTHWRSKVHLAQVQKQEGSGRPTKAHTASVDPGNDTPSTQQDVAMTDAEDVEMDPIDTLTLGSVNATDSRAEEAAPPCVENGTAVKSANSSECRLIGQRTAKQRKRKMERDRKRARAQMDFSSKNASLPHMGVKGSCEEISFDKGHLKDIATPQSDPLGATGSQLVESEMNVPRASGATGSLGTRSAAKSEAGNTALPQATPHRHWTCTLCKTVWKRQKAWQGHLLSAQHMRHLSRTMHEITPPVRPTARLDVMASKETFAWGTGVGLEEEEEEDEEEEEQHRDLSESGAGQGQARTGMLPKDGKHTRDSEGGEVDDDMDLGE
ncbi:hypothetical protein BGZ72_006189 [Mortierella alpina]|nr:hypothetical protein BGZ72_006189 [Mortierella alpina]